MNCGLLLSYIRVFLIVYSEEYCNCIMSSTNNCSDNSGSCNNTATNLIQTELSSLKVTSTVIRRSPGETVQVGLDVFDERDSPTIAFLKIDIADSDNDTPTVRIFMTESAKTVLIYTSKCTH